MIKTFKVFSYMPFEGAVALYIIINAILTLNIQSAVLQNLYSIVGWSALATPFLQMISGAMVIYGARQARANIEACGLIIASTIFLIRAIALLTDGEVTLTDINSTVISVLILVASIVRITHIAYWSAAINKALGRE